MSIKARNILAMRSVTILMAICVSAISVYGQKQTVWTFLIAEMSVCLQQYDSFKPTGNHHSVEVAILKSTVNTEK